MASTAKDANAFKTLFETDAQHVERPEPLSAFASQSLASILNNPHEPSSSHNPLGWLVGGGTDASPSEAPQPLTPTTKLTEVILADFEKYLRLVREKYPRFAKAHEASQRDATLRSAGVTKVGDEVDGERQRPKQGQGLVLAMREIPSKYFAEDFDLGRADTFEEACSSDALPSSLNMVLQEKLSHYLDVVEVHLLGEIAARSDSFFEALALLQDLSAMIHKICDKIYGLRETVKMLEERLLLSAMRVQHLHRRRKNLLDLHDKLRLVESTAQARADLDLLVSAADFAGALDVIEDIRKVIMSGDLHGLHCFRHLEEQVEGIAQEVDQMMTVDFLRIARLEEGSGSEVEMEALGPLVLGLMRTSRLPVVLRAYGEALIEDIKDAVKDTLNRVLKELMKEAGGGTVGGLAENLKALQTEAFLELLRHVQAAVISHLAQASALRGIVLKVVESFGPASASADLPAAGSPRASSSAGASSTGNGPGAGTRGSLVEVAWGEAAAAEHRERVCRETMLASSNAIAQAVEAAHGRWSKLLGVRAAVHLRVSTQVFVSVIDATQSFMDATEAQAALSQRKTRSLRGTMQTQCKAFLDQLHQDSMSKLATLLEAENWAAADVPQYFQDIAMWIVSMGEAGQAALAAGETDAAATRPGAEAGAPMGATSAAMDEDEALEVRGAALRAMPVSEAGGEVSTLQALSVGEDHFHMVNSSLMLLKMIGEYMELARRLPALATDIVHRVAELLKLYNSRTCQLVLGAGAMQVSGLKSITAKHLALANQSLTLVLALLPPLRSTFHLLLRESRFKLLLGELDRLANDFRVHTEEIHTKLLGIMQERLTHHARRLPTMVESWASAKGDVTEPSEFAKALVKEIGVLERVLKPLLLQTELLSLFGRVVTMFNAQLVDTFDKLDLKSAAVQRHLYCDGMLIASCLEGLPRPEEDLEGPGALQEYLHNKCGAAVNFTA